MSNEEDIAKHVETLSGCKVTRQLINGELSLKEQATLFHSAGMILAPHSSQLLNMVFAHVRGTYLLF